MKICDFCKNEIDENAKFCPVCGAEQKSEPIANQPQAAETAETEPLGTSSFGNSQPEAMPFGAAPVNQNQPPVNSGTYFTPGANVNVNPNTEMFNGGAPVQNVAQRKKGKGGKIALIIIGIIVLLVVALIVFGALSGDDSDVSSDPSAGTSQSAGGKATIEKGTVDETGYTNASLGLRINCPEDWEVLAGDDMSEFLEITPDANGEYEDTDGSIYEFIALDFVSGSNIIVSSGDGNVVDGILSIDDVMDTLIESYKENGYEVSEPFKKTIGSTTYSCIDMNSETLRTAANQRMYIAKEGKKYLYVVVTVFPDSTDATLDSIAENYFTNN